MQQSVETVEELKELPALPERYALYLRACLLGCLYVGSHDILVVHQLIEMMTAEESRLAKLRKQKKEEDEKNGVKKDPAPAAQDAFGGLAGMGGLSSLFGALPSPSTPKPAEEAAMAKEDNEFQLKMMVLAIALVAAGESVNESMVTRTLELLLVYGGKSVNEMVRQFSGRES